VYVKALLSEPDIFSRMTLTNCVTKAIPVELSSRGYERQLCVDFSSNVVKVMKDHHAKYGIEWRLMDVRNMQGVEDSSVDVAFDKGTLDAMIHGSPWTPPQEVKDNTSAYLREVRLIISFPPSLRSCCLCQLSLYYDTPLLLPLCWTGLLTATTIL